MLSTADVSIPPTCRWRHSGQRWKCAAQNDYEGEREGMFTRCIEAPAILTVPTPPPKMGLFPSCSSFGFYPFHHSGGKELPSGALVERHVHRIRTILLALHSPSSGLQEEPRHGHLLVRTHACMARHNPTPSVWPTQCACAGPASVAPMQGRQPALAQASAPTRLRQGRF